MGLITSILESDFSLRQQGVKEFEKIKAEIDKDIEGSERL